LRNRNDGTAGLQPWRRGGAGRAGGRAWSGALIGIAALALASPAHADQAAEPASRAGGYSAYEQTTLGEVTARLGSALDAAPEGKIVEHVDVVPLEVIEKRDPAPAFLNYFHATTRPRVIAREALIAEGQPYRRVLCDETARNLRQLQQLSLVICAATRSAVPGHVRMLIVTKDVWSLRLGWELSYVGGGLESLTIVPTETNLGGTHQVVFGSYIYRPLSQTFALGYRIPRVAGLRLTLGADVGLTWNRDGHPEGSGGSLSVSSPLYAAQTPWAWASGATWSDGEVRLYSNAKQASFAAGDGLPSIPWQYHARRFAEAAYVTRSFGWAVKNDFTVGAEMNVRQYRAPAVQPEQEATLAAFVARRLPRSDTRVGPFVQYRGYTSDFLRVLDFETLGLQEDFRLGHDVVVRVYPVSAALGASRTFLGVYAGAQYTLPLGDGLARLAFESSTEAEAHQLADAEFSAELRIVTPRLGIGRLVFDASAAHRYANFLNRTSYLGGESRLRGYPSNFFFGKDVFSYNLEFRSRPVEVLAVQIGGAAFFDTGHAADSFAALHPRRSAGFGVRMLFPQLNRIVFRGDVGFPLADRLDPGVSPWSVVLAFEQAFAMPTVGGRIATAGGAPIGWLGQ